MALLLNKTGAGVSEGGMRKPKHSTIDEKRLRKAGWQKRKGGWKSPYTGQVLTEDRAVRFELFMDPNQP